MSGAARICSLLPSATEIVFALGLGDRLVGVTHECDHPPEARRLPVVTRSLVDTAGQASREIHAHVVRALHAGSSLYALDQALLARLDPDLILTQELCSVCAVAYHQVREAVRVLPGPREVLSLEPTTLDEVLATIETVAGRAGVPERGAALVAALRARLEAVRARAADLPPPRVATLEWLDPPFAAGHWVPEMVGLAGGVDVLGHPGRPSREVGWDAVREADPDVLVLMPCGFDLGRTLVELARAPRPGWAELRAVGAGRVYGVDGSAYFNRPGPRLVDGVEILAEILHPARFPRRTPAAAWRAVEAAPPTPEASRS